MDIGNKDIQYLLRPIVIIGVILVLIGIVFSVGYRQIFNLYTTVGELKDTQVKLAGKLDTLQSVKEVLDENITYVDVALPRRTSVLYGLSQVKKIAFLNNVRTANLKAGAMALGDNGISRSSIVFEAEGLQEDVHKFLLSFYNALPLMSIDKVKLNNVDGSTRADVTLFVYSADNPEKIPAVTDSINGLTSEDIAVLNKISTYVEPEFFDPKPIEEVQKENPFN